MRGRHVAEVAGGSSEMSTGGRNERCTREDGAAFGWGGGGGGGARGLQAK